ncbi:MAG TPA: serine hydrolase domain-containing protein [Candidatus Solibacter sp.]|nr:serine hydrolase domain-containing protein [Candidatus Solibacter sp.]
MRSVRVAIFPGISLLIACGLVAGAWPLAASPDGAGGPGPVRAPSSAGEKDLKSSVDAIIKEAMTSHRIASMVAAVAQNGKTVFQKAYGHDPLYTFAENSPSSGYALGPASKVLTGGAILLLVNDGKVGLDDPVSKYLPEVPESWRPITISQLLAHKSGLPAFPKDAKTFSEAVAAMGKQPLRFKPGSARSENSADFDVLGQVVEKASGEPYLKYMDRTVFKQLKFVDTGDYAKLLFRFVAPQDFSFSTTSSTQGDMRVAGQENASAMSGRGADPITQAKTIDLLYRGMPRYSIPSKGLASNMQDILRLATAIMEPKSSSLFAHPDYLSMAPGWKPCDTGKETMLSVAGLVSEGYGINLTVLPGRRTVLVLLWKMEKGSEASILHDESQDILETALSIPVSSWVCTSQVDETGDDDDQP